MNNLDRDQPDWAEIEKRLEPQYVSFFRESMSMPEEVAREIFKTFAEEQKEAARRDGTDRLPESFGEILLEREQTDEKVQSCIRSQKSRRRHRRGYCPVVEHARPGTAHDLQGRRNEPDTAV